MGKTEKRSSSLALMSTLVKHAVTSCWCCSVKCLQTLSLYCQTPPCYVVNHGSARCHWYTSQLLDQYWYDIQSKCRFGRTVLCASPLDTPTLQFYICKSRLHEGLEFIYICGNTTENIWAQRLKVFKGFIILSRQENFRTSDWETPAVLRHKMQLAAYLSLLPRALLYNILAH